MLSGGEDGLTEVVSSFVGYPSDSRCFFDLGVDVLIAQVNNTPQ